MKDRGLELAGLVALAALLGAVPLGGCNGTRMEKLPGPGEVLELTIRGKALTVETALDEPSRQRGLMFREKKELPEDRGMLFIWPSAVKQSFWMRNTSIPLSIAFLDEDGKILQVEDLRPHDERYTRSKDEVRYALEVNRGWFAKNGLKAGDVFDDFRKKVDGLPVR